MVKEREKGDDDNQQTDWWREVIKLSRISQDQIRIRRSEANISRGRRSGEGEKNAPESNSGHSGGAESNSDHPDPSLSHVDRHDPEDGYRDLTTENQKNYSIGSPWYHRLACHNRRIEQVQTLMSEKQSISWNDVGTMQVGTYGPRVQSSSVIAFDLDGAIIKTKSKRVMPIDSNDWGF